MEKKGGLGQSFGACWAFLVPPPALLAVALRRARFPNPRGAPRRAAEPPLLLQEGLARSAKGLSRPAGGGRCPGAGAASSTLRRGSGGGRSGSRSLRCLNRRYPGGGLKGRMHSGLLDIWVRGLILGAVEGEEPGRAKGETEVTWK